MNQDAKSIYFAVNQWEKWDVGKFIVVSSYFIWRQHVSLTQSPRKKQSNSKTHLHNPFIKDTWDMSNVSIICLYQSK